jgi:hypothetical protein
MEVSSRFTALNARLVRASVFSSWSGGSAGRTEPSTTCKLSRKAAANDGSVDGLYVHPKTGLIREQRPKRRTK